MMMDKRWIKRDKETSGPENHAVRDISRSSAKNAPQKQTNLFASSAEKRRIARDALWDRLGTFPIDEAHLETNRIITSTRRDPSHAAFDVLRTKLLQTLSENGWKRVAITSPTEGCGKTFMASNLTVSFSRQLNCRTLLLDFDMRRPSVDRVLGLKNPGSMGEYLRGEVTTQQHFRRAGQNLLKIGNNIAVGANGLREEFASELLQQPSTGEIINGLERDLSPDVMLFDMPPALVNDDVLAARHLYDGVLLIVGGGTTKPEDVQQVERRLGADTPLLGVVLNKSEGVAAKAYSY
ncbi:CpsD/CapB family tyrosine-protein kinase [Primorskyibacter sp. S187A]|uniref:CpsD/CapB family tyrosine-protein kinase n=1 Tax=Primorskyibacter sp. S187A TaxID=3415130 RepID=UPI003C79E919